MDGTIYQKVTTTKPCLKFPGFDVPGQAVDGRETIQAVSWDPRYEAGYKHIVTYRNPLFLGRYSIP